MPNNQSDCFLLPPSKHGYSINPQMDGEWHENLSSEFKNIAKSFNVQANARSVSSIPDMWARPLLMQMALYDDKHPLHEEMKAQWRGMLAAIALAKVRNLNLTATLVELDNNSSDPLVSFFKEPNKGEDSVYQLEKYNNPWQKIYIFLVDGKVVGMTSPSTIVCPSADGNWGNLAWFKSAEGLLFSNGNNFLNRDEKEQLWLWLKILKGQLELSGQAIKLNNLIQEFQNDLARSLKINKIQNNSPRLENPATFFEESILLGELNILNTPIEPKRIESSIILKPLHNREALNKIYIIPNVDDISKQWEVEPQEICIEEEKQIRLTAIDIDEYRDNDKFLVFDKIFNKKIYFIKLPTSDIPGALFPPGVKSITYNDTSTKITPLLPINLKLLEVLTPEELQKTIELEKIILGEKEGVRITIKLHLSGISGNSKIYKVSQDYTIEEENILTKLPILEVWPNFRLKGWNEYYAFYGDTQIRTIFGNEDKTFRVKYPKSLEESKKYNLIEDGESVYHITRLNDFPPYVICHDQIDGKEQGVILLNIPPETKLQGGSTWKVGVDFGTSFTNVYYNDGSVEKKLELSNLRFSITKPNDEADRTLKLYEYFLSVKDNKLPISTLLTTRNEEVNKYRLILDGRIHIMTNPKGFNPDESFIKTNLKWEDEAINFKLNRIFLSQLALQITAEAVVNRVSTINWAISYPSAFSEDDLERYPETWKKIFNDLQENTPIEHNWLPENDNYWCSESLASAYYFSHIRENRRNSKFTCIDMGGGSSDISIWQDDQLVHQCSVLLAGKDLFSQFLQQRSELLRAFEVNLDDLTDEAFYAKLNALLLQNGNKWLEKRQELEGKAKLQAQELRLLTTIGISGLYYYIGILLRVLYSKAGGEQWKNAEITPVYVGGNGSRIFHWLVLAGEFDSHKKASKLLSMMLQKGSGFSSAQLQNTVLSKKPKDEVACGLVLDKVNLKKPTNLGKGLIAGETFNYQHEKNNESKHIIVDDYERFELPKKANIQEFCIPELTNLQQFWQDLYQTLEELNQETIVPDNSLIFTNDNELWSQTEEDLKTYLDRTMNQNVKQIRPEPPFIIGLKVLLETLAAKGI